MRLHGCKVTAAIVSGRGAGDTFERAIEVAVIVEAYGAGDVDDRPVGCFQKGTCSGNANPLQIFIRGVSQNMLKAAFKLTDGNASKRRHLFDFNIFVVMLMDVCDRL